MATSAVKVAVPARFAQLIGAITAQIEGRALDPALADWLDEAFAADGAWFNEVEALCHDGVRDGWLCARELGGIRFGRPIKPGPESHDFSVDVVEMADLIGPHHAHPNGEIDMVMPIDPEARFDGVARGWTVYQPGSAHHPTVAGGKALVLYLLPDGAITFS